MDYLQSEETALKIYSPFVDKIPEKLFQKPSRAPAEQGARRETAVYMGNMRLASEQRRYTDYRQV